MRDMIRVVSYVMICFVPGVALMAGTTFFGSAAVVSV